MKNVIIFILFLLYATAIFFIPNNIFLLCPFMINMVLWIVTKSNIKKIVRNLLKIFRYLCQCLVDGSEVIISM